MAECVTAAVPTPQDNADLTDRPGLLSHCRTPLIWATGFSLLINVLMLASSLYMMQVYDRVLPSGSLPTLLFLSLITAGALALAPSTR